MGEGILAVAKALFESGVAYVAGYQGAPISHLMDVLAGFQPRGRASLDQMATLLGFPGKLGMSGDKVWDKFKEGGIREIRDYCETDVLNTWLCFLRFEFMRGKLEECKL